MEQGRVALGRSKKGTVGLRAEAEQSACAIVKGGVAH